LVVLAEPVDGAAVVAWGVETGAGAAVVAFGVEAGAAAEVVAFGVEAGALDVAGAELADGAASVATGVGEFRVSDPAEVPAEVPPAEVSPDAVPAETGAVENPLLISAARPA
jgi:Zn-dependent alcohol dehydrogenase